MDQTCKAEMLFHDWNRDPLVTRWVILSLLRNYYLCKFNFLIFLSLTARQKVFPPPPLMLYIRELDHQSIKKKKGELDHQVYHKHKPQKMASSSIVKEDKYRTYLQGDEERNTKWRFGAPPNYDVVNKLFEDGKTKVVCVCVFFLWLIM